MAEMVFHTDEMEAVEYNAYEDMLLAADVPSARSLGIKSARRGSLSLLAVRDSNLTVFNRAQGCGIDDTLADHDIGATIGWLKRHCAPCWGVHLPPDVASGSLGTLLEVQGLRPRVAGPAKLNRGNSDLTSLGDESQPALDIRLIGEDEASAFGSLVQSNFGLPHAAAAWVSCLAVRPRWRTYVAYDTSAPVACGALFIDKEWAWLGCDATSIDHRHRGIQAAIIARRVADGIALGVKGFTVEAMPPVSGGEEASSSYRNFVRAGFLLAYRRTIYGAEASVDGEATMPRR